MLENLRDKIFNVQHDLSASFRNLATGEGQLYRSRKHGSYKGITLNAGGDLLYHYQKQWEELHTVDSENAKKAEEVDVLIGSLHKFCEQQLALVHQLNIQLSSLPKLQSSIMALMGKIGELEGLFEEVEDALLNLEDTIETQELQERQLDHRFQLAMYKEKRLSDYENCKGRLAQEHDQKVVEFEKKHQAILKERQSTFQEAFEEELQHFKTHGLRQLRERVSSTSSADCPVSLESIELAEDVTALDEFLGDEIEEDTFVKAAESEDSSEPEIGVQGKSEKEESTSDSCPK